MAVAAENKLYGSIKKAFLGNERAKDTKRLLKFLPSRRYDPKEIAAHDVSFTPDTDDMENFKKVYAEFTDRQTGHGEAAIYWLLNCHKDNMTKEGRIKTEFCILTQSKNAPDLKLKMSGGGHKSMEVKAYPNAKDASLGRFETSLRTFRMLAAPILGVQSLLMQSQTPDILRLNFNYFKEAADNFCDFRRIIKEEKLAGKHKFFKTMENNFKEFGTLATTNGLKDCDEQTSGPQPGGDHIAMRLFQFAAKESLKVKPGEGQFFTNATGESGRFDSSAGIKTYQIDTSLMSMDIKNFESGAVKFEGGSIKLNFTKLFGY